MLSGCADNLLVSFLFLDGGRYCASFKKVVYNIKTQQEVPFVFLKQESSALMIRPLKQSQTLTKQYYRTLSFPHVTCDFISASCFVKMSHCFLYSTTCLFNWITTKKNKKKERKSAMSGKENTKKKEQNKKKKLYKGEEISFTISHNFYQPLIHTILVPLFVEHVSNGMTQFTSKSKNHPTKSSFK